MHYLFKNYTINSITGITSITKREKKDNKQLTRHINHRRDQISTGYKEKNFMYMDNKINT